MESIILGLAPLVLLFLGLPIFAVLLISSFLVLTMVLPLPYIAMHQVMYGAITKLALISIPFFILAGNIMGQGGISQRIVDWTLSIIGSIRGALALATVGACTVFGAISGSSPATVAAIGGVLFPALRKHGYSAQFASGLTVSAGAIALVIPPSIPMILYAASAEQDVGKLFLAGIVPGILIASLMAVYIYWYCTRHGLQSESAFQFSEVRRTTIRGGWALLTPVIVLGGIYTGIFSPTEAAGVACVYAMVVAVMIYKEISIADVWKAASTSSYLTAQLLIIVAASGVFVWLLTVNGVPVKLTSWIDSLGMPKWMLLLAINILLLLIGAVLEPISAILVFTPLLKPLVDALEVDPIHFGIIMTVNLSIGMFTPPFGMNIFVFQAMFNQDLRTVYKGLIPFALVNIVGLLLITYIPALSLIWF